VTALHIIVVLLDSDARVGVAWFLGRAGLALEFGKCVEEFSGEHRNPLKRCVKIVRADGCFLRRTAEETVELSGKLNNSLLVLSFHWQLLTAIVTML